MRENQNRDLTILTNVAKYWYQLNSTMDAVCDRLQGNDPTLTMLEWPSKSSHCLAKLGRSLVGNTCLKQLTFHRMDLTESAARDLATGIRQSALKQLTFERTKIRVQPKAYGRIQQVLREGIRASTINMLSLVDIVHSQSIRFVLSCAPNLHHLSLRGVALSHGTAKSIANCMRRSCSNMQKLHLEKMVLRGCTNRRGFLDLREPIRILREGMRSVPLMERLEIWDIPFDLQLLDAALNGVPSLRELILKRCVLSSTTARSIAMSIGHSQLRHMHLENLVPLFPMDAYQLWEKLREGMSSVQTIRNLELWDVKGPFKGWENMVAGLDVLSVYESDWARLGISQLADALQSNTSLSSLTLQGFSFTSSSLPPILNALSSRPTTLQTLDLSDNITIGFDGLKMIGAAIQNQPHLTAVRLVRCASDVTPRHSDFYFYHQNNVRDPWYRQQQAAKELMAATHRNPAIEILDVRNNYFPDDVMATIHFHTTLRRLRRYLGAEHNLLADTIWCQILAKCQSTNDEFAASLMYYALSERPTLLQLCVTSTGHQI